MVRSIHYIKELTKNQLIGEVAWEVGFLNGSQQLYV